MTVPLRPKLQVDESLRNILYFLPGNIPLIIIRLCPPIVPTVPVVPIVHCIKKYNAFWL
jgi:hypothetical protein